MVQSVFTLKSHPGSGNAWNTYAAPVDLTDSKLPGCLFVVYKNVSAKNGKYVCMAIKKNVHKQ